MITAFVIPGQGSQFPGMQQDLGSTSDVLLYVAAGDVREKLRPQIFNPVRRVDTVNDMPDNGSTVITERGPGKVLARLARRIYRGTPTGFNNSPDSRQSALEKAWIRTGTNI